MRPAPGEGPGTPSVPRPGEPAPDLALPDTFGTPVHLESLRGTPVCLVFLPMAFSATCTSELQALRDHADEFARAGVRVFGVTCDAVPTLRAWAHREGVGGADGAGVQMLSDFWPHGAAAQAYGAFDPTTGAPRRVSVLVDADGIVRWATTSRPGRARDVTEHLAAVASL